MSPSSVIVKAVVTLVAPRGRPQYALRHWSRMSSSRAKWAAAATGELSGDAGLNRRGPDEGRDQTLESGFFLREDVHLLHACWRTTKNERGRDERRNIVRAAEDSETEKKKNQRRESVGGQALLN